jgi:hypothetical protein
MRSPLRLRADTWCLSFLRGRSVLPSDVNASSQWCLTVVSVSNGGIFTVGEAVAYFIILELTAERQNRACVADCVAVGDAGTADATQTDVGTGAVLGPASAAGVCP